MLPKRRRPPLPSGNVDRGGEVGAVAREQASEKLGLILPDASRQRIES